MNELYLLKNLRLHFGRRMQCAPVWRRSYLRLSTVITLPWLVSARCSTTNFATAQDFPVRYDTTSTNKAGDYPFHFDPLTITVIGITFIPIPQTGSSTIQHVCKVWQSSASHMWV